jgi:hypothetical protein
MTQGEGPEFKPQYHKKRKKKKEMAQCAAECCSGLQWIEQGGCWF